VRGDDSGSGKLRRADIITILRVPKSGGIPTTKVRVVRWFKKEGSKIKLGDPVVELETDKVNYELDSPVAGVLLRIVAAADAEVPVGDPLGCIGERGEALPEF
jgi:pyruvate/2-oxoglutarate dehydrogenase complex dihydrolipoamide acyltransferase (E2) component